MKTKNIRNTLPAFSESSVTDTYENSSNFPSNDSEHWGRGSSLLRKVGWVVAGFLFAAMGFGTMGLLDATSPSPEDDPLQEPISTVVSRPLSQSISPKSVQKTRPQKPEVPEKSNQRVSKSKSAPKLQVASKERQHWMHAYLKSRSDKRIPERKLARLLAEVGFPAHSIPKMVCTARFESAFDTRATNENRNGSRDIGLFQINEIWHEPCGLTEKQLMDPVLNTQCAKKVFDEMGYWAWYGYRKNQVTCRRYEVKKGPGRNTEKTNLAVR